MDRLPKAQLTKKEEDIMKVLWYSDEPLTVSSICDKAEYMGIALNQSTVQAIVNQLMKKKLIQIGEYTQTHKALARAFVPAITEDQYTINKLQQILDHAGRRKKSSFIAALLDDMDLTEDDLNDLTKIIEDMKK